MLDAPLFLDEKLDQSTLIRIGPFQAAFCGGCDLHDGQRASCGEDDIQPLSGGYLGSGNLVSTHHFELRHSRNYYLGFQKNLPRLTVHWGGFLEFLLFGFMTLRFSLTLGCPIFPSLLSFFSFCFISILIFILIFVLIFILIFIISLRLR